MKDTIDFKDFIFKDRIKTLCLDRGIKEAEIYKILGITKQQWYYLSWDICGLSKDKKREIAKVLKTDTLVLFRKVKC
jgi:hypothetical protein